ncbi:putative methyltransferase DDB_G0268948 isoform X3 [Zootoca vivipara]|uniref:putative methyltransferase DDB_G0268948 isoform X3 n=1 Tax=Zootoca vivipara TaxID=8524 RepID=UPI00159097FE|nr:putative methyltransferase DDB_G0268948 isoform X3 [Zootoca vivipara]
MAAHLFAGKDHASVYQKYRFPPPENLQGVILSYLEKKKVTSLHMAVDVGCGTGQSSHLLAKRFEKVVGTDVSEAQIEEAKRTAHPPNVSYLVCPAEELPFEDCSVDLLTAFTAAHWFDIPRFMKEVDRLLKPSGCVALSTNTLDMRLHYKDCSEKLTEIFREVLGQISPYSNEKIKFVTDDYKAIFDSLPFQDKERITDILDKLPMSVADLMGYIQSFSSYQTFLKAQPEAAKSLIQNTEQRILETMGVSSRETKLELCTRHVCVLGYK